MARTSAGGHRSCWNGRVADISLLNDTVLRRTRQAAAGFGHALDDLICGYTRRRSIHLLFEAASPMSLAVFKPVLEKLERILGSSSGSRPADRRGTPRRSSARNSPRESSRSTTRAG